MGVRITNRLVNTPVALVTSQFGYSAKMEKAYQSQGQDMTMSASKTLELNPDHPVIYQVYKKIKEDPDDKGAKETAGLLTQAAILSSGYRLEVPVTEIEIPADLNDDEKPAGGDETLDDAEDG